MKLLPTVYMYHSNLLLAYVIIVQFQFDCVLTRYWLSSYFVVTKIFFGSMDTHSNNLSLLEYSSYHRLHFNLFEITILQLKNAEQS